MATKTIKYSKTDPTGTTTTNAFENFEPWRYGDPAIPAELYFLGVDGNGYQQYFNTNGYGVQEVNATGSDAMPLFEINSKPISRKKQPMAGVMKYPAETLISMRSSRKMPP